MAWTASNHVAWVEAVSGSTVTIEDYNAGFKGTYSEHTVAAGAYQYIHFKDLTTAPTPTAPSGPGPITVLVHRSRVDISWGPSTRATSYQVLRNGILTASPAGNSYLDASVSDGQSYAYSVVAVNSAGKSPAATLQVRTSTDSAFRAYLSTKAGPAECGLAGGPSNQAEVCTVRTSTGWVSKASPANDWGYPTARAWVTNADGSVSNCRTVGTGNQLECTRWNGKGFDPTSLSPRIDPGYVDSFTQ